MAVDFVLLPSQLFIGQLITINRQLNQPFDKYIHLNSKENLPHISLLMGGLSRKDIQQVNAKIKAIAKKFNVITLEIDKLGLSNGCISIEFVRNENLQNLHFEVVKHFKDHIGHRITPDHVLGEKISDSTIDWINTYLDRQSNTNFWPHITLGYSEELMNIRYPEKIICDQLSLFQLGNYCTCQMSLVGQSLNE